jgi:hypothetical protein
MKKGDEPMLRTIDRGRQTACAAVIVGAPDPAKGIGRALRSVYTPGGGALPHDMQMLLDRLH